MAIKYGKAQVAKMVEAIDQDHASAEDAALAALAVAEELLEERAKFVVVGQLCGTRERPSIPPSDPEAIKVALAFFSTEGDAVAAANSLWRNTGSGDQYLVWILPVFYGSPAELHQKKKDQIAAAEATRKEKQAEQMRKSIEEHRAAMEERARGGKGSCITCGHHPYDHVYSGVSRGKCALSTCSCELWKEKK